MGSEELARGRPGDRHGKFSGAPSKVRLDAATYIMDQIIGRAIASVEVTARESLPDLLDAILVDPDGQPSNPIIEMTDLFEDEDHPSHQLPHSDWPSAPFGTPALLTLFGARDQGYPSTSVRSW